ncbi:hypothetical protein Ptr902_11447 [Pyrenophora tritici-repentis]|nr:hypothetical protein Ptr902_11447 [Pyrenophora tritici-repentis]
MNSKLRAGSDELAKHGINALKLCIQTCLDTQTIFPRRLAESLAKLKAHPLIRDPEIRGLYELNLDVHDRWLSDEARNYTPWPRHDELQRPEAERILHRWSKDAVTNFLKGVKAALEGEERLQEVANLRQELIETWILSGSRMAGVKSANVLDDLRETMSEKLENIVRSRTSGLQTVVSDLTTRLDAVAASKEASALSLWSTIDKASDLSNGAQTFKSTILNTHQGRDESVISVTSAFDNWMESVLEVKGIVKSMKEARWDDTFAEDVDDDSDDDLGDSKQTLLSDDDPKLLEEATQEALGEAMQNLGRSFSAMTKPRTAETQTAQSKKQPSSSVSSEKSVIGYLVYDFRKEQHLSRRLLQQIYCSLSTKDEDKAKPTESSSELKNQRLKQLFFDLLYIQRFVDPNGGEDKVSTLRLKVDVTDLDDAAMSRLKKNAADYAKKTYLLFALLA